MRRIYRILMMVILTLGLFSCKQGKKQSSETVQAALQEEQDSTLVLPPVETRKPNTDYKPVFKGQTRVAGMKTKTPYQVELLTDQLESPWGIVALPDGRFLITQKAGTMRIADTQGKLSEPITGIPKVNSSGQGGLLGLAIDNEFEKNRKVYWCFSEAIEGGNLTAVAKGKLAENEKELEDVTVIYRAKPAYEGNLHYGGRIVMDNEGNLFVSTGERSDLETRPQAQGLESALGKVLHITTDGKPVNGNPFEEKEEVLPEIWSFGHRNVQGLAIHPITKELWESEMGPRGGDEINLIKSGKNYGWPIIGYGIEYSGEKVGKGITEEEDMEQPIYYWDPVLSPSGISFYHKGTIPEWEGDLFVGGLNGNHIARLKIENNKVVGEERLLEKEAKRNRDNTQGKDGNLYVITDEGDLYRLAPK